MAILLLAASPTGAYGATSVPRGTGQLDSTPGSTYGETLECPGVFPVKITGKLSVYSVKSAVEILNVMAGPEHLIIQEKITTATPNTDNIVRLAQTSFNYKTLGGHYIEDLTTLNPVDKPYKGVRNLALNGLPSGLFAVNAYTQQLNVGTPPPPVDPNDPANYFQRYSTGFTNTLSGFITEYGHAIFQDPLQGSLTSVNFSLHPLDNSMTSNSLDLRANAANRPAMTVVDLFNSTAVINEQNDCTGFPVSAGTDLPSANFALFNMPKAQRTLPGFTSVGSCANLLENTLSTLSTATANSTGIKAFAALFWNSDFDSHIPFLAINSNNRLFAGTLHERLDQFQPVGSSFFRYKTNAERTEAYTQPAIGFAGNTTTTTIFEGTEAKNLWAAAYPMQPRYHEYLSVNATQYGFILLEKSSKQLQFMLTQHYAQLLPGELQVPAKLVHPPPRSVTWKSAWNMGLGVVPGGSTALTTNTLYRTFANSAAFIADNHIHGGGGHLVALGTFNGILVHNKKVSVWGSNRWGQAVLPSVLQEYQSNPANDFIDVAAAISPPLITWRDGSPKLALDEAELEAVARDYNETFFNIFDPNSVYSYGAYPATYGAEPTRYTGHINYYNLPGHVAVVTSNGRVYCWGNDLYNQCKVPDDIALVDSAGNIRTAIPTDPVEEIACGAFHTVARTKGGAVYVWGAGSPAISTTGYVVVQSGGSPLREVDSSANYMVSRSVHFGQSCFNGDPQSGILYNPIVDPRGLSNDTEFTYVQNTAYSAANIITVQDVNGIVVGQKTAVGFSVITPTGKRLKGMIAAGAFHTAIIDNKFKLQCVGAGRGNYSSDDRGTIYRNWDGTYSTANPSATSLEQRAMWGMGQEDTGFLVTYPHFCQGISSYSAPQELPASDPTYDNDYFRPRLFRNHLLGSNVGKRRPFQDLTFKKVVCGPFTTHGIIYSVSRVISFTDIYSNEDKVNVHGRVVSWGRAWPSEACKSRIGPLGVKIFPYLPGEPNGDVERANPSYNPCVNLNGTGNSKYLVGMELPDGEIGTETIATSRHFSLLNRNISPNVFPTAEGFIVPNDAYNGATGYSPIVYYATKAPVSVSKFKVKDIAVGMDFAGYIGYFNKFQITDRLNYPKEATLPEINSRLGATFDYEASLFFVGGNVEWLPHTFNPHSGFYFVKRNKIGSNPTPGNSGFYYADNFEGNTALKVKTRSYYYGAIKPASGATANVGGVSAINYVMPSTLQISSSGAVLTVNADNRPTAWNTIVRTFSPTFSDYNVFETEVEKQRVLDLSLLPSVPFASIKTGKAHVAGVITSDWPIAVGLETTANIPDLCSSLSTLLSTSISGNTYIPGVLADINKGKQSILWSWGAGDGREYGTGLLSAGPKFNSFLGPLVGGPGLPDFDAGVGGVGFGINAANAYGMWFMDTHAMTRYDDSLSGTPAGYATPPTAGNGEPSIIARNYKKLSDTAGMSSAVNYYGQYRWLIHSEKNNQYSNDADFQTYTFNGTELIKPDSHLVESLQAKFNFNVFNYPTSVATGLTSSNLLNGTQTALIPVAFGMPWLHGADLTSIDAKLTKCCTTAADATSVDQQLNHLQEWHGPLSLEIQNEVDYIVDYATGAQTTGVLFVSTADYAQIEAGNHLINKANYLSYFTNSTNALLRRFDKRRVCKAAIAGYGCENQTGGAERRLKDGSVAPIIPQLFARTAKIYCGNSYTAVTDPVRVHTFTSTAQTLNFTSGATKTFTFNVPSEKYSNRIRGIDVRLTLTCTGASGTDTPVPLNNWVVKIPYKNTEWNVLNNFQRWNGTTATPVTIKGTNLNNSSVLSSTYVFSDRYAPNKAYSYSNEGLNYSEAGLTLANVTVAGTAYSLESAAYSGTELYPILPNATTVNATNYRLGCYAPYSYDAINRAAINAWHYVDTSVTAQPYLAFDEPTINLTVTNSGATVNYTNLTLSVELIVEVDAGPYPLAIYGRKRAGIWNNYFGEGPTYQADYFAFDPSNPTSREEVEQACPCLLDPTINNEFGGRQKPVSFPTDKNFICGTLKYGPSGNPEIAANALTISYPGTESNKLLGLVTSNFTSVFSQLLHRPLLDDITAENNLAPVLNSLPAGAFIAISTPVDLGVPPIPITPFKLTIPSAAPTVNIGLNPALINTYRLNTGSADLQRAILGIINFECKLTTNAPALNLDSLNLIHCTP